jgi:signal peptidase II
VPNAAAEPSRTAAGGRGRFVVGIVVAVVVLDQASKAWAVAALPGSPVTLIGGTLELALARNTGSAFSLFQTLTPFLAVLAVAIALLLVRVVRRTNERIVLIALALVLGGALGNLCDRLFRSPGWLRGAVVDFIHLSHWPTFNVADSAITVGAVLLVVWSLFGGRRREASP